MAREPFEGSEWGERSSPSAPRRRRRPLPALLAVAGVVVAGVGAALAIWFSPGTLEAGAVSAPVIELRETHERSLRKAATAPVLLGVRRRKLESIADCESHGNPRSVSSDGTYRGKYQFDKGTWKSQGGSGDPAKAPELEQDLRAAVLYRAAGSNPWPNCG